jgi:hypothetical protein
MTSKVMYALVCFAFLVFKSSVPPELLSKINGMAIKQQDVKGEVFSSL